MKKFKDILVSEKDIDDKPGDYDLSPSEENEILDMVVDLLTDIDPDKLTDKQAGQLIKILDMLDVEIEDELDEVKKVRIDPAERRKRKAKYRKKKGEILRKAKKYRKSAHYKKLQKKKERAEKLGRTATGRKKTTFV